MIKKSVLCAMLITGFSVEGFATSERLTMWLKGSTVKMDYTETSSTGVIADTENSKLGGNIKGFETGMTVKVGNGLLGGNASRVQITYSKNSGDSDYAGSILGSNQPFGSLKSTTSNVITQSEIGWIESRQTDYGNANFVFGFGNRLWERKLSAAQIEDYEWKYWNVGLGFDFYIANRTTLGLNAQYQRALSPEMRAKGAPLNATFKLGTTDGYRVEIPLSVAISKNIDFVASYAYDYWNIKASNVVSGYYEPDSKTKNFIASAGVMVKW